MEQQPLRTRTVRIQNNILEHYRQSQNDLWKVQQYNYQTFCHHPLAEISGSVGDIGTLLPILIALTETKTIHLSSTLVFSGLANILTGMMFGIPLPVQPMKAIAAVAISRHFSPGENAAAGLFVAAAIGLLSFTGLIQWFTSRIPIPVIKGIQVGTGLSLVMSAGRLYDPDPVNNVVLLLVFFGLLISARFATVPYALIILVVGILSVIMLGSITDCYSCNGPPRLSVWHPQILVPNPREFVTGTLDAGIGQLPLTALNSVIAVSFLASDLLPELAAPSTTSLGLSVMVINLIGCWFGAMPVCHGSGGLAAQYRFGARSGASIIFLGLVKLLLGLFAQKLTFWVFKGFPSTLLCILVIAAGLELAKVGESLNTAEARDLNLHHTDLTTYQADRNSSSGEITVRLTDEVRKRRWTVMFMTVAGILAFRNAAIGFFAGIACDWSFRMFDAMDRRNSMREGRIRFSDERLAGPQHTSA